MYASVFGSDNGLSPGRHQAIIWTNAGILLIGLLGTNFSEILIEMLTHSLKKMHLKLSSVKWWPVCFGLNMLNNVQLNSSTNLLTFLCVCSLSRRITKKTSNPTLLTPARISNYIHYINFTAQKVSNVKNVLKRFRLYESSTRAGIFGVRISSCVTVYSNGLSNAMLHEDLQPVIRITHQFSRPYRWRTQGHRNSYLQSVSMVGKTFVTLRWRHNGRDSVSNHQPHNCLLNRLFGCRSKKISKLRVTGHTASQMASNAENVSIWWRHHEDVVTWKRVPHCWPIPGTQYNALTNGPCWGALVFPLLSIINSNKLLTKQSSCLSERDATMVCIPLWRLISTGNSKVFIGDQSGLDNALVLLRPW